MDANIEECDHLIVYNKIRQQNVEVYINFIN